MPETIEIEEAGFISVRIGEQEIEVDLYSANNHLICASSEVTDELPPDASSAHRALAFQKKVAGYLQSVGFERVSLRAADAFADAIFSRVQSLGKAEPGAPTPG